MPRPIVTTRRRFLQHSLAALGAGGVALSTARVAWASGKRVLLVGDSMISGAVGIFLERELEGASYALAVRRKGKTSSGLARPDFYDWMKEGRKALEAEAVDAVACMFGGNDGQGLWMGKAAPSPWIRYEDGAAWTAEYRARVGAFADLMSSTGASLHWIGMPIVEPTKLRARVAHMNEIFAAEMSKRSRSEYIDIWSVLADAQGEYAERLPIDGVKTRVRATDGVHVAGPGATLLAKVIAPRIHAGASAT